MAIKVISIKCPECGASLSVESTREFLFCQYCGTKVMLNNENEHIYRTIDEAGIKQAETDRMVKMRQLDMEEKANKTRKILIIAWLAATATLIILGIIGFSIENSGLEFCMLMSMAVGVCGLGFIMNRNNNNKATIVGANEVLISSAMADYFEKNYSSLELLYKGAGFENVTSVPLKDLSVFTRRRSGQVEEVTINGNSNFGEGDVYPKSASVVITYHSR
jgi:DNA-directed RNA polymerase subunit RPC12/RpoP